MEISDFRLNREELVTVRTVFDSTLEQAMEKDILLPDYYPDIFRIIKCSAYPAVTSQNVSGDKLTFETCVYVKILYVAQNDCRINCVEQKITLSKSAELNEVCENPAVSIAVRCDSPNCRVVNQRRLDIRGIVTSAVRVSCEVNRKIVTDAFGGGIQLKKQPFTYPSKRLFASKRITLIQELEPPSAKPSVGAVLRTGCVINQGEQKIIAGKLITKGEAEITLFYSCVNAMGEDGCDSMKFSLPFSQIIDIAGIDDSFTAEVDITLGSCEIVSVGEESGKLECELILNLSCTALKYETADVAVDAYSTCCECELTPCDEAQAPPIKIEENARVECTLSCPDGETVFVYDSLAEVRNVSARYLKEKNSVAVAGTVVCGLLGAGEDKAPFYIEKEQPFECEAQLDELTETAVDVKFRPKVSVADCSYYISTPNSVEMKISLKISGAIEHSRELKLLSDIVLLADKPKTRENSCALKLCRCEAGEDIWDIAKRYSTDVDAIIEENEQFSDKLAQRGMILIPITNREV